MDSSPSDSEPETIIDSPVKLGGMESILDAVDPDMVEIMGTMYQPPEEFVVEEDYAYEFKKPTDQYKHLYNEDGKYIPTPLDPTTLSTIRSKTPKLSYGNIPIKRPRNLLPERPVDVIPRAIKCMKLSPSKNPHHGSVPNLSSIRSSPTRSLPSPIKLKPNTSKPYKCRVTTDNIKTRINAIKFNPLGGESIVNLSSANPSLTYSVDDTVFTFIKTGRGMPRDLFDSTMELWREDRWDHLVQPPAWLEAPMYGFCFLPNTTSSHGLIALSIATQNLAFARANDHELNWEHRLTLWTKVTDTMIVYSPPALGPITLYDALTTVADKMTSLLEVFPTILNDSATQLRSFSRKIVGEAASFSSSTGAKIDQMIKFCTSLTGLSDDQSGKIMLQSRVKKDSIDSNHPIKQPRDQSSHKEPNKIEGNLVFLCGKWMPAPA